MLHSTERVGESTMRRTGLIGIVAVIAIVGGIVAVLVGNWAPTIPADAASTVVATTSLSGPVPPDAADDAADQIPSPVAQECLPSIDRPAGPMSLCYEAIRIADADPQSDYYRLRVYGTFGGDTGSGVRWAVVRARLLGAPDNQVFNAEPDGDFEGVCPMEDPLPGSGEPVDVAENTLCRATRTRAGDGPEPWSHQVAWTCTGCLIPDHWDRDIWLTEMVAVPAGTLPQWEILADLGS
jgi:hypothetical protein